MNPLFRSKVTHNPDDMEGQFYVPVTRALEVTISGSGTFEPFLIPANYLVHEVQAVMLTPLDAGTLDIGDEDNDDVFIDNTDFDETTEVVISSRETTAPSGVWYPTAKNLLITVGGAATEGVVALLITMFDLNGLRYHQEVEVS